MEYWNVSVVRRHTYLYYSLRYTFYVYYLTIQVYILYKLKFGKCTRIYVEILFTGNATTIIKNDGHYDVCWINVRDIILFAETRNLQNKTFCVTRNLIKQVRYE